MTSGIFFNWKRVTTDSVDFSFLCSSLQTSDPTHASECLEEARTRMADRGDVGISDTRTQHTDCVHWLPQSTHSTECLLRHVLSLRHVLLLRWQNVSNLMHCLHVLSLRHVLSPCSDKTCRKVHSLHVLSLLPQQHYNLSFPSLVVCVCVCVCVCVRARWIWHYTT